MSYMVWRAKWSQLYSIGPLIVTIIINYLYVILSMLIYFTEIDTPSIQYIKHGCIKLVIFIINKCDDYFLI